MSDHHTQEPFKGSLPAVYRIELEGETEQSLSDFLGRMQITIVREKNKPVITTVEGRIRDQAELTGLLNTFYDMHLVIRSVKRIEDPSG